MSSMVRKTQKSDERPTQPLLLTRSREDAAEALAKRLAEARDLLAAGVSSEREYGEVKSRFTKWNEYNSLLLKGIFTSDEIAEEYNRAHGIIVVASSWHDSYRNLISSLNSKITKIESIIGRLELIDVRRAFEHEIQQHQQLPVDARSQAVFIGHGRSKLWARVKSFLQDDHGIVSFSFESETHVGESIVPVLEGFLERASFAILILTAEDETLDGKIRARQNVVHEAGLFQGKLGFKKAIVLRQDGLEDFSNVDGLQYIGFTEDNIEQTFYELGRVLKREGVIK
jgi:predicted nucleotide-binding protein